MRKMYLVAAGMAGIAAGAAGAQQARTSPDDIVCAMTGSCGGTALSADRQIQVGQEKSFSLVKPNAAGAAPASTAARTAAAPAPRRTAHAGNARRSAPAVRPASGRLDMLVTFPNGSAQLAGGSQREVQSFAAAMKSPNLAGMRFNIEGHTDAVGARDYNLDLSRRRAQSVADYLVAQGVDRSRLSVEGYGFDKPRKGLSPSAPGNRRVEFVKAG